MDNSIQNPSVADLLRTRQTTPAAQTPVQTPEPATGPESFAGVLQDKLKVSGHAATRIESRGIQLGDSEWQRVIGGVDKAAAKGAKESLVMVDNVALVVSVRNRTVITAVDQNSLKDNVFTNIDSAVIV